LKRRKVAVNVKPATCPSRQTLAAAVPESSEPEEEATFQPTVSNDILSSANLSLPKLSDIANMRQDT